MINQATATVQNTQTVSIIGRFIAATLETFSAGSNAHQSYLDQVAKFERDQIEAGYDVWRFGEN